MEDGAWALVRYWRGGGRCRACMVLGICVSIKAESSWRFTIPAEGPSILCQAMQKECHLMHYTSPFFRPLGLSKSTKYEEALPFSCEC